MTHDRLADNLRSSDSASHPFAVSHSPFAICHLPSALCHLPSVICHPPFRTHSRPFSFSPTHAICALELNFLRVLSQLMNRTEPKIGRSGHGQSCLPPIAQATPV